ncbi:DUF2591 domain-containing protein [Pseudomonas syringae pv. actinidiae]|nr:DUF2591 domain-containing protein [Pseudomonas syringae pv. actinidiae]
MKNRIAADDGDRMVEVRVVNLTPLMIDWLTARMEGIQVDFDGTNVRHSPAHNQAGAVYSPSTSPQDGHPIIEREKIQTRYVESPGHKLDGVWLAQDCRFRPSEQSVSWLEYGRQYADLALGYLTGPTILIAGLRFLIAKHHVGKSEAPTVSVPAKLVIKRMRPRPMSPLMEQVLSHIAEGRGAYYGCSGRSEHGGRNGTIVGLTSRGYITGKCELTEAGRAILAGR